MTPGQYLYFDKRGTDSPDEPVSLNLSLPLEKIYGYDPAEGLSEEEQQYLLGVQANLWTEFVATGKRVEYQLLPRIYALSEIAWSPVARKSWEEFSRQRLPAYLARLDAEGAAYQVPQPHGIREETLEGGCFRLHDPPAFPRAAGSITRSTAPRPTTSTAKCRTIWRWSFPQGNNGCSNASPSPPPDAGAWSSPPAWATPGSNPANRRSRILPKST